MTNHDEPKIRDVDDSLLHWARLFIRELADGQHQNLYALDDFTFDQHVALAGVVSEAMSSTHQDARCAAAWIVSQLEVIPDDVIADLRRLLKDETALVRLAAAWALGAMRDEGREAIPDLVAALKDRSGGVQFAAVSSLGEFGAFAKETVPMLVNFARTTRKQHHKAAALKSLAAIDANDRQVQSLLMDSLLHEKSEVRFFATSGIAATENAPAETFPYLASNLADQDQYVTLLSAWTLRRMDAIAEAAVPALLEAMNRIEWLEVVHGDEQRREYVSVRPDLSETLTQILPSTNDDLFRDFRVRLFSAAFHPQPTARTKWIDELVQHRWYLKLQRRRFGHPSNQYQRQIMRELLPQAQAKFAARLLKNPTLGITPEAYRLLPGFIKNHARNIAWRLRRRIEKDRAAEKTVEHDDIAVALSPASQAGNAELISLVRNYLTTELPDDERDIATMRWFLGWSIEQIAAGLDLSISVVRTRESRIRSKLLKRFRDST